MDWQWRQLDHIHVICISFQTDNHASTLPLRCGTDTLQLFLLQYNGTYTVMTDRHQFNGLFSSTTWVSRQQKG